MQQNANELQTVSADHNSVNELVVIYRSILRHKWPIIGLTLAVVAIVFSILQAVTPIYQSSAKIIIEQENAKVLNVEELFNIRQSKEYFNSQIGIIKSRETMLRVIKELKLWNVPEFDPRNQSKEKDKIETLLDRIGIHLDQNTKEVHPNIERLSDDRLAEMVVSKFEKRMQVEPVKLSQLVVVSFESEDPKLSQMVANAIANTYIANDRDSKLKMAKEINVWLNDRLEGLRTKLMNAEIALQNYREKNGVLDVNGSLQSIEAQQISGISDQLTQAKVRKAELEGAYFQINRIRNGDYSTVPAVMKNELVMSSRKHEAEMESRVSEIKSRYGSDHPKIIAAMSELRSAQSDTKAQMALAVSSLKREYEIASATVATLERSLNSAKSSLQTVNRTGTGIGVLQRDVDSQRQIYETFLNRAKQTGSTADLQTAVARVIDEATLGEKIKPKKSIILAVSLMISLLIGSIVAIWYERADHTIKGPEDAEVKLGVPVLTSLPAHAQKKGTNIAKLIVTEPESLFAEGIRTANTGISLTNLEGNQKVILVTSSIAGEGKTTFALNLARSFASSRKVLLIDGDMRQPNIAKSAGIQTSKLGLASVLIGQVNISSVIINVPDTKLSILPVGFVPTSPIDLIRSSQFKLAMDKFREHYDLIIIDSPPIGLVSDAMAYLPLVDAAVYVVKCMDTQIPLITKGIKQILSHGTNLIGVVLNQLDFKLAQKYYGEYSPYSKYGYKGYGYGSGEVRKEPILEA
jgi:polysaccharide biosynthesis transport protein